MPKNSMLSYEIFSIDGLSVKTKKSLFDRLIVNKVNIYPSTSAQTYLIYVSSSLSGIKYSSYYNYKN